MEPLPRLWNVLYWLCYLGFSEEQPPTPRLLLVSSCIPEDLPLSTISEQSKLPPPSSTLDDPHYPRPSFDNWLGLVLPMVHIGASKEEATVHPGDEWLPPTGYQDAAPRSHWDCSCPIITKRQASLVRGRTTLHRTFIIRLHRQCSREEMVDAGRLPPVSILSLCSPQERINWDICCMTDCLLYQNVKYIVFLFYLRFAYASRSCSS